MNNYRNANIIDVLAGSNYIIINKIVANELGAECAILLGVMCGYQSMFGDREFYREEEYIAKDTSLSIYAVRKAKEILKNKGILQIRKVGLPAKHWFKINKDSLYEFINNCSIEVTTSGNENITTSGNENITTSGNENITTSGNENITANYNTLSNDILSNDKSLSNTSLSNDIINKKIIRESRNTDFATQRSAHPTKNSLSVCISIKEEKKERNPPNPPFSSHDTPIDASIDDNDASIDAQYTCINDAQRTCEHAHIYEHAHIDTHTDEHSPTDTHTHIDTDTCDNTHDSTEETFGDLFEDQVGTDRKSRLTQTNNSNGTLAKELFDYWNSKKLRVHRAFQSHYVERFSKLIQNYSIEQIKHIIDNYEKIVHDKTYYWTYIWDLQDFIDPREQRFLRFADDGQEWLNFKQGTKSQQAFRRTAFHNEEYNQALREGKDIGALDDLHAEEVRKLRRSPKAIKL